MKNEWVSGNGKAKLLLGDSVALIRELPAGFAGAVITDPPYSSGGQSFGARTAEPSKKYVQSGQTKVWPDFEGDNRDQRSWAYWLHLWISEAKRILQPGGYFLCFSDWRQVPTLTDAIQAAGLTWRGIASWDKGLQARAPHKGYLKHQCEFIVWATKGPCLRRTDDGPFPGCFSISVKQSDKWHMTGKPTELLRRLVAISPPGGTVVDPFAGSCTTGVACLEKNRPFVGFELSEDYFRIGVDRLKQAAEGLPSPADHG